MNVLIAHRSLFWLSRLRQRVSATLDVSTLLEARTLTDAYHQAEHHAPELVIIAAELAQQAEFELLASLLRLMNIRCLVISATEQAQIPHSQYRHIALIAESALPDVLASIDGQTQTSGGPRAAPVPDTAIADTDTDRLILLGASTGGIDALLTVVQCFDARTPPVLIVQHTGGAFAKSLIRLLDGASLARVVAAKDQAPVVPGHIYMAPDDQTHLTLAPGPPSRIALLPATPLNGHRPSVDALFQSALAFAPCVSAALLTGMGKDGATGLTQLRQAGAFTIGQDRQSSVVYGMPRVAMEMGGVSAQLPIDQIGPALLASCQDRHSA